MEDLLCYSEIYGNSSERLRKNDPHQTVTK